jgi:hypothetical protein
MGIVDRRGVQRLDDAFHRHMIDRRSWEILCLDPAPAPSAGAGRVVLQQPSGAIILIETGNHRVQFCRRRFPRFLADQQRLPHIGRYVVEFERVDDIRFRQSVDRHPAPLDPFREGRDLGRRAHLTIRRFLHLPVQPIDLFLDDPDRFTGSPRDRGGSPAG